MPQLFDIDPILLDLPETIQTPRLVLQAPRPGDGVHLSTAVKESWESFNKWESWAINKDEHSSLEYWETKNRSLQAKFILREALEFRIFSRENGKFIGIADICYPNWRVRSFVIGYWVTISEQNKGYATEAAHALLRYCFDVLSSSHVGIGHAVGNTASQKVIEKLGFKLLGTRPNILELPQNRIVDDMIYFKKDLLDLPDLKVTWE